jgi:hypothetical protein
LTPKATKGAAWQSQDFLAGVTRHRIRELGGRLSGGGEQAGEIERYAGGDFFDAGVFGKVAPQDLDEGILLADSELDGDYDGL